MNANVTHKHRKRHRWRRLSVQKRFLLTREELVNHSDKFVHGSNNSSKRSESWMIRSRIRHRYCAFCRWMSYPSHVLHLEIRNISLFTIWPKARCSLTCAPHKHEPSFHCHVIHRRRDSDVSVHKTGWWEKNTKTDNILTGDTERGSWGDHRAWKFPEVVRRAITFSEWVCFGWCLLFSPFTHAVHRVSLADKVQIEAGDVSAAC